MSSQIRDAEYQLTFTVSMSYEGSPSRAGSLEGSLARGPCPVRRSRVVMGPAPTAGGQRLSAHYDEIVR